MKFLEGQTAFVTGGSRGMGKAIALHLAGAGAKVAVCARREGDLEAAGRELRAIVPDCLALPLDISRAEDVQ
nr:SDR family NAD(P)-dependent oxidoreductase [bacterium]